MANYSKTISIMEKKQILSVMAAALMLIPASAGAKAKKKKALERCFEQPVPAEVYDALAAQLAGAAKEAEQNGEA